MKTETGRFIRLPGQTPDLAHWRAPGSSRRPDLNYRATTGQNIQTVLSPTDKSITHPLWPRVMKHPGNIVRVRGPRQKVCYMTICSIHDREDALQKFQQLLNKI